MGKIIRWWGADVRAAFAYKMVSYTLSCSKNSLRGIEGKAKKNGISLTKWNFSQVTNLILDPPRGWYDGVDVRKTSEWMYCTKLYVGVDVRKNVLGLVPHGGCVTQCQSPSGLPISARGIKVLIF